MSDHPPTLMALDDEEAVRGSYVDYFEDRRWRVLPAGSAEEALGILEREEVDAVIVDIRLPGMDGNAFIRAARTRRPGLAFVVVSGSPEYRLPPDIAALPGAAAEVYMKPVELATLEAALHDLTGRRREEAPDA